MKRSRRVLLAPVLGIALAFGPGACVEPELEAEPAGYGEAARDDLIDACGGVCEQIIACTEEPYDSCTAECQTGAFVGRAAEPCVAEYTALIACFDQPQCDFSILSGSGDASSPCAAEADAYFGCDRDHGIACDGGIVPSSWICDGVEDCSTGADERDCR